MQQEWKNYSIVDQHPDPLHYRLLGFACEFLVVEWAPHRSVGLPPRPCRPPLLLPLFLQPPISALQLVLDAPGDLVLERAFVVLGGAGVGGSGAFGQFLEVIGVGPSGGEDTVLLELLGEVDTLPEQFGIVAVGPGPHGRAALLDAERVVDVCAPEVLAGALEPRAVEGAHELLRLPALPALPALLPPPARHDRVHELVEVDVLQVAHQSLPRGTGSLVARGRPAAGRARVRRAGLDREAGLRPRVEVRAQLHREGVRAQRLVVVLRGAVVVEAVQEVVEVDCFYFLFLFLGLHHQNYITCQSNPRLTVIYHQNHPPLLTQALQAAFGDAILTVYINARFQWPIIRASKLARPRNSNTWLMSDRKRRGQSVLEGGSLQQLRLRVRRFSGRLNEVVLCVLLHSTAELKSSIAKLEEAECESFSIDEVLGFSLLNKIYFVLANAARLPPKYKLILRKKQRELLFAFKTGLVCTHTLAAFYEC